MSSVRCVGLDVHRDTISAAVLKESGRRIQQSILATRAGGDSGVYRRNARDACDLRGANSFGVAVRFAGATGGRASGMQPAPERAAESGNKNDAVDARKLAELLKRSRGHGPESNRRIFTSSSSKMRNSGPIVRREHLRQYY